jgi:lambda repressor-like predicted transcriptional regulator
VLGILPCYFDSALTRENIGWSLCASTRTLKLGLRVLKLLVRATSSPRTRERPTSRQAQVRLDHYQANALAAAYRDGKTINELADRYGIHRVTTASLLRRLGVERRRVGLSDEQVDEASRLYPEGWSLARLAERYGVNDMTVRQYLLLGGVEMRSPHERCK